MRITIHGSSDDNFCFTIENNQGKRTRDEWGCYQAGDDEIHLVARLATIGLTKGVFIRAIYDGTWSFAVGKLDEGRSLPGWRFELGNKHEYSTELVIETGDDLVELVRVEYLKGRGWVPTQA
jgi:hypothetical protein